MKKRISKKILIKVLWQSAILAIISFFMLFVIIKTFGPRSNNNVFGMGGAPTKFKSISFKDTCKELPYILGYTIGVFILVFPVHFGFSYEKYKKMLYMKRK